MKKKAMLLNRKNSGPDNSARIILTGIKITRALLPIFLFLAGLSEWPDRLIPVLNSAQT